MSLTNADDMVDRALSRDLVPLARLLSQAERGGVGFGEIHDQIHGRCGRAIRIGFTGPPGVGKSTLVEGYALRCLEGGNLVSVVAVDPTSPYTGGALLGDRVRMSKIAMNPRCFVRSMASRGSFGGLARRSDEVADVFDAAGYDRILLETVGVGQSEVDVARATDVTVVVLMPGAGDSVQAMKAGLMEVADIIVVNKSDRNGADRVVAELEEAFELRTGEGLSPSIVKTVATTNEGLEELDEKIEEYMEAARASGDLERRRRAHLVLKVRRIVEDQLRTEMFDGLGLEGRISKEFDLNSKHSPYALASQLLEEAGLRRLVD